MKAPTTELFHLSHLNLQPSDPIAGSASIAVMQTENTPAHAYFFLTARSQHPNVTLTPVMDVAAAKHLLHQVQSSLTYNRDLQLSHLVCQGIVMGYLSPNGRLFARTEQGDVAVTSFDDMRAFHLSPVLPQNTFEIVHGLIRQHPGACVEAFAKAGGALQMRGWDFENTYARLMSGLMMPDELNSPGLIQACRQATLEIATHDPAALSVLWSQLNKVERVERELPAIIQPPPVSEPEPATRPVMDTAVHPSPARPAR